MTWTSGNASDALRAKINEASKRLKDLEASAKSNGQKAKTDAKAYLASLDEKMKKQRTQLEASRTNAKAWVQQKMTDADSKIAEWKSKREVKKITNYADGAETYAAASMDIASAAIDEAERATLEAIVARIDAEATQARTA